MTVLNVLLFVFHMCMWESVRVTPMLVWGGRVVAGCEWYMWFWSCV